MQKRQYTNIIGTFLFKEDKMIARDIKTTKKMDEDPDFIFPKLPEFQKQFYELNMKQTAKVVIVF